MKNIYLLIFLLTGFTAAANEGPSKFSKDKPFSAKSEQLIIFYKNGCPYCENMNKVLEKEKGFSDLLQENFTVQRINIETEEGRLLANQFNVHAVPALIRFDPGTGANSMIKGFPGVQKLAALLNLDYVPVLQAVAGVQSETGITKPALFQMPSLSAGKILLGCGDGIIQAGEQCDDGNVVNGDGCSSTCQVQTGFSCTGTPSVCTTTCGDGIKAGAESCDDGNTVNGDGCSSVCTVQSGFFCTGSPSVCATICGDGIKVGAEQCDDGNTVNGDGCGSTCNVESGYSCTGSPSVCTPTCGDGIKTGAEQCDDGNTTNGDGCTSTCTIQPGFFCTGSPSVCATICGDGIVAGAELCDDGNVVNGDGCNGTCNVESGYSCSGSPSVCTGPPPNDDCLNAITLSGTSGTISGTTTNATNPSPAISISCTTNGQKDVWYKFTLASSTFIRIGVNTGSLTDPIVAVYRGSCGSLIEMLCNDDINPPNRSSLVAGTLAANTYFIRVLGFNTSSGTFSLVYNLTGTGCGDGTVQSGEECDDGNVNPNDGCSSACLFENTAGIKGVSINLDGSRAAPSSMLDVKATDRGILIPRMSTAQRTAISSPAGSLIVYDLTTSSFWYFKTGTGWVEINGVTNNSGFSVINNGTVAFNAAGPYIPTWPTEQYDDGNNFSANAFTVSQAGVYKFDAWYTFNVAVAPAAPFSLTANIYSFSGFVYASNSIIVPAGFTGTINLNVSANVKVFPTTVLSSVNRTGASTLNVTNSVFSGFRAY